MTRTPVTSSDIAAVGYENGVLEVEFVRGRRVYRYKGVPLGVYHGLVTAQSVGVYFARHIRGSYAFEEVKA